jgi:cell division protein FtsL
MKSFNIKEIKILRLYKSLTLLSLFVLIVSIIFRIYTSNQVAVKNEDLKDYYTRRDQLEKELSRLEYVDSTLSSLTGIETKAKEMGFVELNETLLTIDTRSPVPVASLSN